jgi:hypothetical protein
LSSSSTFSGSSALLIVFGVLPSFVFPCPWLTCVASARRGPPPSPSRRVVLFPLLAVSPCLVCVHPPLVFFHLQRLPEADSLSVLRRPLHCGLYSLDLMSGNVFLGVLVVLTSGVSKLCRQDSPDHKHAPRTRIGGARVLDSSINGSSRCCSSVVVFSSG